MDLAQRLMREAEGTASHSESEARKLAAEELARLLELDPSVVEPELDEDKGSSPHQRRYLAEIGGLRWLVLVRTPLGSDAVEVERFYLGGRYCDWLGRESHPMSTKRENRYCSNTHHLARRFAQEDEQAAESANWGTILITFLACICVIVITAMTGALFGAIALVVFSLLPISLLKKSAGRKRRALPEWEPSPSPQE